ncbi:MAG TPA: hypothetical protein VFT19_01985 [Solirubrobacterales bacterium]|nr:hypothetical protein [Solirubrobacterales bacterium]
MADVVIYCDGAADEIAAESHLAHGVLAGAKITRLPRLTQAPDFLRPLLSWERFDWVVVSEDEVRCTVELSRHGYTGDNGFQRFARLYRSASLGIPTVYFTPFSRTRLNELDEGRSNARNVAPELFETLTELEQQFGTACVAVNWTVHPRGQPVPLQDPSAEAIVARLTDLIGAFATHAREFSVEILSEDFPDLAAAMDAHAQIAYRGGDTRGTVELPIDVSSPDWVHQFLPDNYFRIGKADKTLASLALDSCTGRPIVNQGGKAAWTHDAGHAWVQYLGYQWRPDPSCGLIALSATKALARSLPLIVVWPRVFLGRGGKRAEMLDALQSFKGGESGQLVDEMRNQGREEQLAAFRARVTVGPDQFGVFSPDSKIGRVLKETADALILGDAVLAYS